MNHPKAAVANGASIIIITATIMMKCMFRKCKPGNNDDDLSYMADPVDPNEEVHDAGTRLKMSVSGLIFRSKEFGSQEDHGQDEISQTIHVVRRNQTEVQLQRMEGVTEEPVALIPRIRENHENEEQRQRNLPVHDHQDDVLHEVDRDGNQRAEILPDAVNGLNTSGVGTQAETTVLRATI